MKRKYNVLILIILFSFFFFRSAAAFSFPDFSKIFSEIKVKILKTKKEEQFTLKKNALLEVVNLSIDNYQEQIKILKERCPIEEESLEKGNLFSQIIKRYLIEKNRPLIKNFFFFFFRRETRNSFSRSGLPATDFFS